MMLADDLKTVVRGFFGVQKALAMGVLYLGMGALFMMSVVGTIASDIVILTAILSSRNRADASLFLTGYLWGMLLSPGFSRPYAVAPMLLASPLLTGLANILSVLLGVPAVGWALGMGWVVAGSIVVAGAFLLGVANGFLDASWLQPSPDKLADEPSDTVLSSHQKGMSPLLSPSSASHKPLATRNIEVYTPLFTPPVSPSVTSADGNYPGIVLN